MNEYWLKCATKPPTPRLWPKTKHLHTTKTCTVCPYVNQQRICLFVYGKTIGWKRLF